MMHGRSILATSLVMMLASTLVFTSIVGAQDAESSAAETAMPLCLDPSVADAEMPGPCLLESGTCAPETMLVPMTFAIDEGWTNLRSFPDLWVIGTPDDYLSFMVGPVEAADGRTVVSPEDLLSLLASDERLDPGETVDLALGGRSATALDVTNVGEEPFELYLPSDRFFLEPGGQARIIVLQGEDTATAFIVEGYGELGLEGALELTQPVLDSVVWLEEGTLAESPE